MAQGRAIGSKISGVLAKIEKDLEEVRDQFLMNVAEDLVVSSPVWSGRYVTSHSIGTTSRAGQFTENLEPQTQKTTVPSAYKSEGLANLMADIAALPAEAGNIYISNNAPHARIVEYGGVRTPVYAVYEGVSNRAGLHLQEAVNTVKAGR